MYVGIPVVMVTVDGATNDDNGIYNVMIGAGFNVTCMLNCPITTTLTWRQNGTIISNSSLATVTLDGFSVKYRTNSGYITGSVLTRSMAQLTDTAMYQCGTTVQNVQSNDSVGIFVYGKCDV